jgi:hypothetical protein
MSDYKTYEVRVYADDTKSWRLNGERHREDGPAVENADGSKQWFLNDQRHREDGPAVENADGTKSWWLNGIRHREDGPAYEGSDGHKEWWLNGEYYDEKDFHAAIARRKATKTCEGKIVQIEGKKYKLTSV